MRMKFDWFLAGLAAVLMLAWAVPGPGATGGWLHSEILVRFGIAVIFFLNGAGLSLRALRDGALRWPLHLVVQLTTFVVFPLLGAMILTVAGGHLGSELGLGIFYLCALPSTIASSVALTVAARGNVAGAVFNATASSLLGVVATPFWVALAVHSRGSATSLGAVVPSLVLLLVLPLLAGQFCRRWIGGWVTGHRGGVDATGRGIILLLVYAAFCDSFASGVWSTGGFGELLFVGGLSVFLLAASTGGLILASRMLGFSREDRIAAVFCGSQKTLATGVPMAGILFGTHPALGPILLPILLYHPLQLLFDGLLANRWARG